jgi:isopenicillin N synthase-like dioxygenase
MSVQTEVVIPIIDISKLLDGSLEERREVAMKIGDAAKNIGFFVIIGHQIDSELLENTWSATRAFFDLPVEEKLKYVAQQDVNPFGYSKFGEEVLSAGKDVENKSSNAEIVQTPDLKEMFSLGPADPAAGFPPRHFPVNPPEFQTAQTEYYEAVNKLACHILRAFAIALDLPSEDFFEKFVDHHASAVRSLNYPSVTADQVLPGQLRASAHTDYGTITILKSDGPGLQVSKDKSPPSWVEVPHVEGGFVVNLGDLMRRWTNDEWLSTLHRVVVPSDAEFVEVDGVRATRRRQSMAFFHNLNRDAVVEVLLRAEGDLPKHEPIIAGKFLMEKHLASIGALSA